ncbi:MAG: AzlD domain-containing protein [Oscillospiraceae bacterium]|nr:AzlD domain-containing protein [Oscillospiraceae bacterium]
MTTSIVAYIGVMAGVTYLVRMLPFVIFRKKIKSRFVKDFLYYVPYAVLGAMTIPAAFYSTGNVASASVGIAAAVLLALKNKGLLAVAAAACIAAFAAELLMKFLLV